MVDEVLGALIYTDWVIAFLSADMRVGGVCAVTEGEYSIAVAECDSVI